MMIDPERGTGRTSRQMREAPQGAAFVWVSDHLDYPRRLARALGRTDLVIMGPVRMEYEFSQHGGRRRALVVDHAARLSSRQIEAATLWGG